MLESRKVQRAACSAAGLLCQVIDSESLSPCCRECRPSAVCLQWRTRSWSGSRRCSKKLPASMVQQEQRSRRSPKSPAGPRSCSLTRTSCAPKSGMFLLLGCVRCAGCGPRSTAGNTMSCYSTLQTTAACSLHPSSQFSHLPMPDWKQLFSCGLLWLPCLQRGSR